MVNNIQGKSQGLGKFVPPHPISTQPMFTMVEGNLPQCLLSFSEAASKPKS